MKQYNLKRMVTCIAVVSILKIKSLSNNEAMIKL